MSAQEKYTARGTIIHNLKTITGHIHVRKYLWYLTEKIQAVRRLNANVLEVLACGPCRYNRIQRLVSKGKRRVQKWSDITTLMKSKINTDMLVQRLFNSHQQILF